VSETPLPISHEIKPCVPGRLFIDGLPQPEDRLPGRPLESVLGFYLGWRRILARWRVLERPHPFS